MIEIHSSLAITQVIEGDGYIDTDHDGIPDYLDLDSDDDGKHHLREKKNIRSPTRLSILIIICARDRTCACVGKRASIMIRYVYLSVVYAMCTDRRCMRKSVESDLQVRAMVYAQDNKSRLTDLCVCHRVFLCPHCVAFTHCRFLPSRHTGRGGRRRRHRL